MGHQIIWTMAEDVGRLSHADSVHLHSIWNNVCLPVSHFEQYHTTSYVCVVQALCQHNMWFILVIMYIFGKSLNIRLSWKNSIKYSLAPITYPITKLLDYVLSVNKAHTYKKAELKSFLQFHCTGKELLHDDDITILNDVNPKNVKMIQGKYCSFNAISNLMVDHRTLWFLTQITFSTTPPLTPCMLLSPLPIIPCSLPQNAECSIPGVLLFIWPSRLYVFLSSVYGVHKAHHCYVTDCWNYSLLILVCYFVIH